MSLWTNEEKRQYVPRDYPQLKELYEQAGISINEVERRAQFLAEEVLKLGMTDQDLNMRTASLEGRAAALNQLEDWVIAGHKDAVQKAFDSIPF